jgi:hypothetical protein
MTRCHIYVDERKIISAATEWWAAGTPISSLASSRRGISLNKNESKDRSLSYAERGGVSRVNCRNPSASHRKKGAQLFVIVYSSDPAPPNESAMKNLVTGYAKAVGASSECN